MGKNVILHSHCPDSDSDKVSDSDNITVHSYGTYIKIGNKIGIGSVSVNRPLCLLIKFFGDLILNQFIQQTFLLQCTYLKMTVKRSNLHRRKQIAINDKKSIVWKR